jgi:glycosyltransferase involved in cell wall biosynthesis
MSAGTKISLRGTELVLPLVSVLLPLMNEVESLNKTIDVIVENNPQQNFEFIIILSPKTDSRAIENLERLKTKYSNIKVILQVKPSLGGALIDGINSSTGSHVLMMATDLETNPSTVSMMISRSEENPDTIIATSRWAGVDSGFYGYHPLKKVLNLIFQRIFRFLYKSDLTDVTFGFRLYPRETLLEIEWQSHDFSFLLESLIAPLLQGAKVIEIPTIWSAREEGTSNNSWRYYKSYFLLLIRMRLNR